MIVVPTYSDPLFGITHYKIKRRDCDNCTHCTSTFGNGAPTARRTPEDMNTPVFSFDDAVAYQPCWSVYSLTTGDPVEVVDHITRATCCRDLADMADMFKRGGMLGKREDWDFHTVQLRCGAVRFNGPFVPHWLLHPRAADERLLDFIETMTQFGWLPTALRDMWTECTVPAYKTDYAATSNAFLQGPKIEAKNILDAGEPMSQSLTAASVKRRLAADHNTIGEVGCNLLRSCTKQDMYDTDDPQFDVDGVMDNGGYIHLLVTNLWQQAPHLARAMLARRKLAFVPKMTKKWSVAVWAELIVGRMRVRGDGHAVDVAMISEWLSDIESAVVPSLETAGFEVCRLTPTQFVGSKSHWSPLPTIIYAFPGLGKTTYLSKLRASTHPSFVGLSTCEGQLSPGHCHLTLNRPPRPGPETRQFKGLLKSLFPASSPADHKHTRLRLIDAICAAYGREGSVSTKSVRLNRVLSSFPVGTTAVYATGAVAYGSLSDMALLQADTIRELNVCGAYDLRMILVHKAIANAVRRTGRWLDGRVLTLREIGHSVGAELFCGRSRHIADWSTEKLNRTSQEKVLNYVDPATGSAELGLQKLTDALRRIVPALLNPTRLNRANWRNFIMNRQHWLAGGSACGAKIISVDGKEQPPTELNKRILMEFLTSETIIDWLGGVDPRIIGTGSDKNENGKARAIYGTDIQGYMIMSFVLSELEPEMRMVPDLNEGDSGYDEILHMQQRAEATELPGMYTAMADYQDFNIQHTLAAQSAVFGTIYETLDLMPEVDPTFIEAVKWCQEALLNQYIYFPGDKEKPKSYAEAQVRDGYRVLLPTPTNACRVTQGLLSGLRGTNFINTLLNKAYLAVAEEDVARQFGVTDPGSLRAHKGDDLWLSSYSPVWQSLIYRQMVDSGLLFQLVKQLFSTRGEYLRVGYSEGHTYGYLCRAIAAWMIAPIQSTKEPDFVTALQDICRTAATVFRRGGEPHALAALRDAAIRRECRISLVNSSGKRVIKKVPTQALGASFSLGGIDLGPPCSYANHKYVAPYLPRWETLSSEVRANLPSHMASDQISMLWGKLELDAKTAAAIKRIYHDQNTSGVPDIQAARQEGTLYDERVNKWISQVHGRRRKIPPRGSWADPHHTHEELTHIISLLPACSAWDHVIAEFIPSGMSCTPFKKRDTSMDVIERAIRSSPYRNTNIVAQMVSGDQVALTRVAISYVQSTTLREQALEHFNRLLVRLGSPVFNRVLQGFRGDGTVMAYYLSPSIQSHASRVAVECLVSGFADHTDDTPSQWAWFLSAAQHSVLVYIAKNTNWLELSRS